MPRVPRTLANAAGLLLVGGWLSAFASAQILVGGPMFLTIRPDWSATDGETVIPAPVVLAWTAVGLLLALGAAAAFLAYGRARAGDPGRAFAWGVAASLLPPVNPVSMMGMALAWRARRARTAPLPAATAPSRGRPSVLLRTGSWLLLAGAALSAVGAVGGAIETVAAFGAVGAPAAGMLLTMLPLSAVFAAGAVTGVLGWRKARQGLAGPAAGWGLAAGLLPPMNPVLLLGALLCFGSPERQSEPAAPEPALEPAAQAP